MIQRAPAARYANGGAGPQGGPGPESGSKGKKGEGGDNIVDAEFEEKK